MFRREYAAARLLPALSPALLPGLQDTILARNLPELNNSLSDIFAGRQSCPECQDLQPRDCAH